MNVGDSTPALTEHSNEITNKKKLYSMPHGGKLHRES